MRKRELQSRPPITDREYQSFFETFVDGILDPRQPWLVDYALSGGFNTVPTEEYIESGRFAWAVRQAATQGWTAAEWMYEAFQQRDKEKLVQWYKKHAKAAKLGRDDMAILIECTKSKTLKRSLKGLGEPFIFRKGPKPQLPRGDQSAEALRLAELIYPAVLRVLTELSTGTAHTIGEILQYLQKDYPEACEFLIRHSSRFEVCLKDPAVLRRASKRFPARARAIADAMAGSEYGVMFSTSMERVGEARRRRKQSPQI